MSGAGTTGLKGGGGGLRRGPSELSACSPALDSVCVVVKGSWSLGVPPPHSRPLPLSPGPFSVCLPCADGLIFCLRAFPAKAWPAAPVCSTHPVPAAPPWLPLGRALPCSLWAHHTQWSLQRAALHWLQEGLKVFVGMASILRGNRQSRQW